MLQVKKKRIYKWNLLGSQRDPAVCTGVAQHKQMTQSNITPNITEAPQTAAVQSVAIASQVSKQIECYKWKKKLIIIEMILVVIAPEFVAHGFFVVKTAIRRDDKS